MKKSGRGYPNPLFNISFNFYVNQISNQYAFMIARKSAAFKEAPPINPPSISG